MKISTVKTTKSLVLVLSIALAGHVFAADNWFSGTASGAELTAQKAAWTTNIVGDVTVNNSVLEIDLPTNTVVKLTPTSEDGTNKRTSVTVDGAVFNPVLVSEIDNSVVLGSQTAITAAYDANGNTNYYAYITNTWVKLSGSTPSASAVNVTVVLDYSVSSQTNVSFKIGSTTLRDEPGNTEFPIAAASQRALSRIDMAGYGKLHSIAATVDNVSITPESFEYGADFTNVTVRATVSSTADDTDYYLTWGGNTVKGDVDGTTVTFRNVPIAAPTQAYQEANYSITAKVDNSPIYETGNLTTTIADERKWIDENEGTTKQTAAGGSWTNAVTYANSVATIADENKFVASNCSTGDLVTVTFRNLVYSELSDITVETPLGTQGAFALAEKSNSTNFMVLAMENSQYTWKSATCSGGVAVNTNIAYTVAMSFDYVHNKYSVSVSDGTNTGVLTVNESTTFDICVQNNAVHDFVFKGSGTLAAIEGAESTGYMAKDEENRWYLSIDAAINSGNAGPFTILRSTGGTSNPNWKIEEVDGVLKLIKKVAKGMFFFAF